MQKATIRYTIIILALGILSVLYAEDNATDMETNTGIEVAQEENRNSIAYKCNSVFESRKNELLDVLDRIDDEKQVLESLNSATKNILDRKSRSLDKKENFLLEKEKKVNVKLARLKALVKKNEKILKEIKDVLNNKITEAYSKMGASKAANILNEMDFEKAAGILFNLEPKSMSNILAKMEAASASEVTLIIKRGPPFKTDINTFAIKKPENIEKALQKDFE